jgi:hypothetical protein
MDTRELESDVLFQVLADEKRLPDPSPAMYRNELRLGGLHGAIEDPAFLDSADQVSHPSAIQPKVIRVKTFGQI